MSNLDRQDNSKDRAPQIYSEEISNEHDIETYQPGTEVRLTINDIPIATLRVRINGVKDSECKTHHYEIRPIGLGRAEILRGNDIFHSQGEINLRPDAEHTVGGYFAGGTTVVIGERKLELPMALVEVTTEEYDHFEEQTFTNLLPKELTATQLIKGVEETSSFHFTHRLGTVSGALAIGSKNKNQDFITIIPDSTGTKLCIIVLDGNGTSGDIAAKFAAEKFSENVFAGSLSQAGVASVSTSLQQRYPSTNYKMGTTFAAATLELTSDGKATAQFTYLGDSRFAILRANELGQFDIIHQTKPHNWYYKALSFMSEKQLTDLVSVVINDNGSNPMHNANLFAKAVGMASNSNLDELTMRILSIYGKARQKGLDTGNPKHIALGLKSHLTRGISNMNNSSINTVPDIESPIILQSGDKIIGATDGLEGIEDQVMALVNKHKEPGLLMNEIKLLFCRSDRSDDTSIAIFDVK